REAIFWHYPNFAFHRDNRLGSAVRMGDYKLLEFFEDNAVELYNLREDLGERNNLAGKDPDRVTAMRKRLHRWRQECGANMPRPRK
ncbi:MAG TPA: N-acetylgalactosamine-6-sulfatase, partial [Verrucomicrobiales bacterium]|nr:N-acetylgalactosamine-6-sulfatase [Verrucomicrobiales bacterium]